VVYVETYWRLWVREESCAPLAQRIRSESPNWLLYDISTVDIAPAIRESNLRQVSMKSNRIGTTGGVWIGVLMRDYDDQPNKAIPNNNEEQGFRRVFPGVANPELLKRTRGVEVLDISDNDLRVGACELVSFDPRRISFKLLIWILFLHAHSKEQTMLLKFYAGTCL